MPKYFVRVVLTETIEAENRDAALLMLDYTPGGLDVHEVDIERVLNDERETRA